MRQLILYRIVYMRTLVSELVYFIIGSFAETINFLYPFIRINIRLVLNERMRKRLVVSLEILNLEPKWVQICGK